MNKIKRIIISLSTFCALAGCTTIDRVSVLEQRGSEGQFELYYHYRSADNTDASFELAMKHLKRSADMGNVSAKFTYAVQLEKSASLEAAIPYYKESATTYNGHAQLKVAYYLQSINDHKSAQVYFKKAEAIGYPEAVYELANYHEKSGNLEQAYKKFKSLTDLNFRDSKLRAMKLSFLFSPLKILEFDDNIQML